MSTVYVYIEGSKLNASPEIPTVGQWLLICWKLFCKIKIHAGNARMLVFQGFSFGNIGF